MFGSMMSQLQEVSLGSLLNVPDLCCRKQMLPVDMFVCSLCQRQHRTYEHQYLDRSCPAGPAQMTLE